MVKPILLHATGPQQSPGGDSSSDYTPPLPRLRGSGGAIGV